MMKLLKAFLGTGILAILLFSSGSHFVACTKTVHDTLTIKDTINIKDTVTIKDTVKIGCSCYDPKDGLVAYYNFKNGSLGDSSGKNNHIVFNNATKTTDRFGHADGAYLFNGSSNYMRITNSASLNPDTAITMVAIIKINGFYTGTCHVNQIIGKVNDDNVNGFYSLRFSDFGDCYSPIDPAKERFIGTYGNNTRINGVYGVGVGDNAPTSSAKIGQWYQIAFTYQGGKARFYLNGDLIESKTQVVSFTPNSYDLYLGGGMNPQYPYWFNGVIDEVRIYNKALCPEAIDKLYKLTE